jgi:two-component system, NarL family, response regulator NreC
MTITTQGTISLVVADDHAVVRSGLCLLLDVEPDFAVVDEAGDVQGARDKLAEHRPDVLVLDLNMPGEPTLPALDSLAEASPDTRVVVLTMFNEPVFAREALRAGASAFVLKHAADGDLVKAVRIAAAGGRYVQPELAGDLLLEDDSGSGSGPLTPREREVLGLLALGHTNGEVADRLCISVRTAETHRANIHTKLGATGRADLVRYALEQGLIGRE